MVKEAKECDYIVNLSGLYDSDSDVYIDPSHVKDTYKCKISETIYKSISSKGWCKQ